MPVNLLPTLDQHYWLSSLTLFEYQRAAKLIKEPYRYELTLDIIK